MRNPSTRLTLACGVALVVWLGATWPMAQQQPASSKTTASEVGGVWDDLVAPAGAINPLGADGQASVVTDATTYIGCLEFNATGETAVVQWQLSHGTLDNSDLKPHLHWLASGADVTGSATFQAKFRHCPQRAPMSSKAVSVLRPRGAAGMSSSKPTRAVSRWRHCSSCRLRSTARCRCSPAGRR